MPPSVSKSWAWWERRPIFQSREPPTQRNGLSSKLVYAPDNWEKKPLANKPSCQVGIFNSISLGVSGIFDCLNVKHRVWRGRGLRTPGCFSCERGSTGPPRKLDGPSRALAECPDFLWPLPASAHHTRQSSLVKLPNLCSCHSAHLRHLLYLAKFSRHSRPTHPWKQLKYTLPSQPP